jgi:hypothetical protein
MMRRLAHLLAADLRRHRVVVAFWLLVVASTAILDGVRPALAIDPALRGMAAFLGSLLWPAELLLRIVLVGVVVQTHPLVGSDAFWTTRPIPPRSLLASKLVLLGVLTVVAPAFARAALMAAYGVPAALIGKIAVETALSQTFWLVVLMAAASLTSNLTRLALLCGGALVALAVIIAATAAIMFARIDDGPTSAGTAGTEEPTAMIVFTVLATISAVALLAVQYRDRSRIRSIPVGVAGLFLAVVVSWAWPWPVLAPKVEVPAWAASESALRLVAPGETVEVNEDVPMFSQRTAWRSAHAQLRLTGVEPGWSADVGVLDATLQLDGGTTLASAAPGYPVPVPIGDEEHPTRGVVGRLLRAQRVVDSFPPRVASTIVFFLRDAEFSRLAPATGSYRGRFHVTLTRHDIEARLPLRSGATHHGGAYRVVVDDVERTSGSVSILARESDAASIFDRRPAHRFDFYLRHERSGEAVLGNGLPLGEEFVFGRFLPFGIYGSVQTSGFRARGLLIRFPPGRGAEGVPLSIDDRWVEEAELVVLRATREGSVERTLEIAGFPLRAPARPTALRTPPP